MRIFAKLVAAIMCACIACTGCGCLKSDKASCVRTCKSDSVMVAALGDSVSRVILDARNVTVVNTSTDMPDNASKRLRLSTNAVKTLQFLLEDPANYRSDKPVYGSFNPSVIYTFKSHRKEISVQCDFGLGKFAIVGKDGSRQAVYDLGNRDMLRFALTIYPSDRLLQAIYNNK